MCYEENMRGLNNMALLNKIRKVISLQEENKKLRQEITTLRNDYMKSLEREEQWLKKIFDMEIKLAQYKFNKEED